MFLTSTLIAAAMQVGPNPTLPYDLNPHDELRNRPSREEQIDPSNPTTVWLAECLTLLETDPARAHTKAQIRLTEVTGADYVVANHCLGLAATQLELWSDAQTAFLAARDETPEDEPRAKARFGIMAGNAAMAQTLWADAFDLLRLARVDARKAASAELQAIASRDMARALVEIDQYETALQDLETATELVPEDGESWLLKATLLRRLDRLAEAQTAIEQAAVLAPLDSEIGLEAGVIAILSGREDAARQSWQSVIDTQPDSLAAEKAKGYLEQIGPAQSDTQPEAVQGPNP